jgi:uncharacterized protein YndB with AHSA1/START domain
LVADTVPREASNGNPKDADMTDEGLDAGGEISIRAAPQEVWDAIVEPAALSAWFGAKAELEPRASAPVRFRFPDGTERRGLVEDVVPGRRLTWRWRELHGAGLGLVVGPSSTVTIDLRPDGQHTVVRVTEVTEPRSSPSRAGAGAVR